MSSWTLPMWLLTKASPGTLCARWWIQPAFHSPGMASSGMTHLGISWPTTPGKWSMLSTWRFHLFDHELLLKSRIIVDTVYNPPSAISGDFWTSTLYMDAHDYTLNGRYVCEVNYNSNVTRREAFFDVKGRYPRHHAVCILAPCCYPYARFTPVGFSSGCPAKEYTCKTGGGCIPCSLLCDGLNDCGDMSDEFGCNTGELSDSFLPQGSLI